MEIGGITMISMVKKKLLVLLAGVLALCIGVCVLTSMPNLAKAEPMDSNPYTIEMVEGVSIRKDDSRAIRFQTKVETADINALIDAGKKVEVVTLISMKRFVPDLSLFNDSFNVEGQSKKIVFSVENGNLVDNGGYEVPVKDGYNLYNACIYNVQESNIAKDFIAVSYIKVDDAVVEGTYTKVIGGDLWTAAKAHLASKVTWDETSDEYKNVSALCDAKYAKVATIKGFDNETYELTVPEGQTVAEAAANDARIANELMVDGAAYYKGINDADVTLTEDGQEFTAKMNSLIIADGVVTGSTITAEDTTVIKVPAEYNGVAVTELNRTFNSANCPANKSITKVYAPSVTKIFGGAFSGCTALTYVDLSGLSGAFPYSTSEQAWFSNCTALKTLILGESFDFSGNAECFSYWVDDSTVGEVEDPILDIYISSANGTFKKPSAYKNTLLSGNVYNKDENGACGTWKYNEDKTDVVLAPAHKNDVNNFGVCSVCGKDMTSGITYEQATVKNGSNTYTGYIVTGYTGSDKEVYVREKYNGLDVVAIGKGAFKNKTTITKAYLPESVKVLFNNAFGSCTALTYVSAPGWEISTYNAYINDVATACDNTFSNCSSLNTMIVGASFDMSGNAGVFNGTAPEKPILDIYLSSSDGKFISNSYAQSLLSDNVYKYDANGACGTWKYNEDKTDVILMPGHKNDVNNHGVCSVCGEIITQGLTYEYVEVANGSTNLVGYQVTGYTGTSKEVFVKSTYNGFDGDLPVVAIGKSAFNGNTNITKVVLPSSVKMLRGSAFRNCTALTYVDASGVTFSTYGDGNDHIFSGCTSLKTVIFGSSFDMSGNAWVFDSSVAPQPPILDIYLSSADGKFTSNSYDNRLLSGNIYHYDANGTCGYWKYNEDKTDVILLPAGHKNDANNFGVCSVCGKDVTAGISYIYDESLGGYVVSSGVEIDQYTMQTAYTGTDKEVYVRAKYNGLDVVAIGRQAFKGNTNITKVYAPSVTGVYGAAFSGCSALEYIDLSSVTVCNYEPYRESQFNECVSLTTLILGESFDSSGNATMFATSDETKAGNLNIYLSSANGTFKKPASNYSSNLLSGKIYYYSKEEPTDTTKTYWHYDEETGLAVLWE